MVLLSFLSQNFKKDVFLVDGVSYTIWVRDVIRLAGEIFSDPKFRGHTALQFELKTDHRGQRVRDEFHTGDWFQEAQVRRCVRVFWQGPPSDSFLSFFLCFLYFFLSFRLWLVRRLFPWLAFSTWMRRESRSKTPRTCTQRLYSSVIMISN